VQAIVTKHLDSFLKKYAPPQDVCALIEKNKEYLITLKNCYHAVHLNEIPGFYFKGTCINRIVNAIRLQNFIHVHNLTCLRIAKKYIYPIDDKLYIFAQEVLIGQKPLVPLSLQEVQQIAFLAEETGYKDFGWFDFNANLKRDIDDKIVFIDTENRSFYAAIQYLPNVPKKSRAQALYSLLFYCDCMTQEGADWLKNRVAYVLDVNADRYKNNIECVTILESYEFDDPDIHIKEVYKDIKNQRDACNMEKKKNKGRTRVPHPA